MQILIGQQEQANFASVCSPMLNKKEIGARIVEARVTKGLASYKDLAERLKQKKANGTKATDPETVRLWEVGKVIPPYDKVEQLADILEVGEEWILFNIRRDEQIKKQRHILAYITEEEQDLLTEYRRANQTGQKQAFDHASKMAKDFPAPMADVLSIKAAKKK